MVEGQAGDGGCEIGKDKGTSEAKDVKTNETNKVERKKLSDVEAAVIIQSAYRGFEVRKWEPLKKLKQIAKVSEQVAVIKDRIQALESYSDLQCVDKQRVIIGETIMSLLLKLDTIQGLHPSVRDIRKSVARELVTLQEKLDSLIIKESEASFEQASTAKPEEDFSWNTIDGVCIQGGEKEAQVKVRLDNNSSDIDNNIKFDSVEPSQGQHLPMADAVSGSQDMETLEPMLVDEEVFGEFEGNITKLPVACGVDSNKAESEPLMEPKKEENNEVHDVGEVVMPDIMENHEDLELDRPVELPFPTVTEERTNPMVEVTRFSFPVDDSMCMDKDLDMNEFAELPRGVFDQEPDVQESGKHEQIETEIDAVVQGESNATIVATSPEDETAYMDQVEKQPDEAPKEGPLTAELKDKSGSEKDEEKYEKLEEARHEPEELPVQSREVSHTNDHVEVHQVEEDKIRSEKDGELIGDGKSELKEFSVQPGGEVTNINDLAEASKVEELPPKPSVVESEIHDVDKKEEHGVTDTEDNTSVLEDTVLISEEKELPVEETKECCVDQKTTVGEGKHVKLEQQKYEFQELESVINNDNMVEHNRPCGSETAEEEALVRTQFVPIAAKRTEEEELSPLSPTASRVSLGSDRKLREENEKLREIMERMIEAGKEQLAAISDLSGRVKDLEKRLSRKKKLHMRRNRAAASRPSCLKPF